MQPALSKIWSVFKSILSVPLYFIIGMIILFVVYYIVVYIGSDYNSDIIDIDHCRTIHGTWDYQTNRCKL